MTFKRTHRQQKNKTKRPSEKQLTWRNIPVKSQNAKSEDRIAEHIRQRVSELNKQDFSLAHRISQKTIS
jgi:hypothetical protein